MYVAYIQIPKTTRAIQKPGVTVQLELGQQTTGA